MKHKLISQNPGFKVSTRYPPRGRGGWGAYIWEISRFSGWDLGNKDSGHGFWEISDGRSLTSAVRKNDISEAFEFLNPIFSRLRRALRCISEGKNALESQKFRACGGLSGVFLKVKRLRITKPAAGSERAASSRHRDL